MCISTESLVRGRCEARTGNENISICSSLDFNLTLGFFFFRFCFLVCFLSYNLSISCACCWVWLCPLLAFRGVSPENDSKTSCEIENVCSRSYQQSCFAYFLTQSCESRFQSKLFGLGLSEHLAKKRQFLGRDGGRGGKCTNTSEPVQALHRSPSLPCETCGEKRSRLPCRAANSTAPP